MKSGIISPGEIRRGEYKYDAFISYRHLSPDKAIAERLQKMLEAYVPPKGCRQGKKAQRLRLFRDETELPTSNDLGGDIKLALEQSRFLIVVCSGNLLESKWCMQEINYFRTLHGESNRQILTLYVGDPDVSPVFPEQLRFEPKTVRLPDGTETVIQEEIEPLAANVSAKTLKQSLKRLKVEFMRIAAPLLGCGFDDLYQREQRRRNRRRFSGFVAAAAVFALVAVFCTVAVQQGKQIKYKNAESLANQSQTMENAGAVYEALVYAAQALPEKKGDQLMSNSAMAQVASLTGAYRPDVFTATKKLSFPSEIKDLCLLNGGKSLLVITNEESSLWNVQTGEQIRVFEGEKKNIAYFHDPEIIGELSIDRYANGVISIMPVGNKGFVGGKYKVIADEKNKEEDAVFYIDETEGSLSRISPADGSVIWSKKGDFSFGSYDAVALTHNEGLPVIVTESNSDASGLSSRRQSVRVLNFMSGEETAVIGFDQLKKDISEFSEYDVNGLFCVQSHLLLLHQADLYVYQAEQGKAVFRFSVPAVVDKDLVSSGPVKDVQLYNGTLMLLGKEKENVPTASTFFLGFDVSDGRMLWKITRKAALSSSPVRNTHIGVFQPSPGADSGGGIVFGVVDCELFVVDPITGEDLGSVSLMSAAQDLYYGENGIVFILNRGGQEIAFSINDEISFINKTFNDVYMVECHDFQTEIEQVSYCNNTYAVVCDGRMNEAVVYVTVENNNKIPVFQLEEKTVLRDGVMNADHSLLAVNNLNEKELYVVDVEHGGRVCTIDLGDANVTTFCFFGKENLAVVRSDAICIYNAATGETITKFEKNDGDKMTLLGASQEIVLESDGNLSVLEPDKEPEQIFDLEEYLQRRSNMREKSDCYFYDCFGAPSGSKLVMLYEDYGEKRNNICVLDRSTGEIVELEAPDFESFADLKAAVWSADESEVYLLTKKVVAGYRCKSGKTIFQIDHKNSLADLIVMEDRLFALDNAGALRLVNAEEGSVESRKSILLNQTVYSHQLNYQPADKGRGILRCGKTAWLIDVKNSEIVFRVDDFIGFDPAANRIYTSYYNYIYAYPMLSGFELRQRAQAMLR